MSKTSETSERCLCRVNPSGPNDCPLHGLCNCFMETWGGTDCSECDIHEKVKWNVVLKVQE